MKNKLLIGTILPSVASIGLIGSGFSLWVFNETNEAKLTNNNIKIEFTQVVRCGDITTHGETQLVLDQKHDVLSTGCYFESEEDDALIAKYSYDFSKTSSNEAGYIENDSDIKFTTTIQISDALASYVTFDHTLGKDSVYKDTSLNTWTSSNDGTTYTFTSLASNHKAFDDTNISSLVSTTVFDWDNVSAEYTENYPQSLDEYETMISLLNNTSITVTYSAEAYIK